MSLTRRRSGRVLHSLARIDRQLDGWALFPRDHRPVVFPTPPPLPGLGIGIDLCQIGIGLCYHNSSRLPHPHRLEHRVHRVGVEAGLELGEQLAGDGRDVGHAGHRQQDTLPTGVEGDLYCCLLYTSPSPRDS